MTAPVPEIRRMLAAKGVLPDAKLLIQADRLADILDAAEAMARAIAVWSCSEESAALARHMSQALGRWRELTGEAT